MPGKRQVCIKVAHADYAPLFEEVWGPDSLDAVKGTEGMYERIVEAIAAYERSAEVNPFTSKFDMFWANAIAAGKDITLITAAGIPGGMGGGGMGAAAAVAAAVAWAVAAAAWADPRTIPLAGNITGISD